MTTDEIRTNNEFTDGFDYGVFIGRNVVLKEVNNIILEHKDCKEYHKSFNEDKTEYYNLSCIAQILIDLQKLEVNK